MRDLNRPSQPHLSDLPFCFKLRQYGFSGRNDNTGIMG
jgi:hypothetical protein